MLVKHLKLFLSPTFAINISKAPKIYRHFVSATYVTDNTVITYLSNIVARSNFSKFPYIQIE